MSHSDYGPFSQYNSLTDPNLQGYFSNTRIRKHLVNSGLISKKGDIVPDPVYKNKIAQKEHKKHVRQMLAHAIVQKALDIERYRQAQLRKELETISKLELVRRVKGTPNPQRDLPLLWQNSTLPSIRPSTAPSDKNQDSALRSESLRDEDLMSYNNEFENRVPRPPQSKPNRRYKRKNFKNVNRSQSASKLRSLSRSSLKEGPNLCKVTMRYHGKGVNVPYDTDLFGTKDEITVFQQHCGGENLTVYRNKIEADTKFSFYSKRHKEYPFSLSIYINNTYDCRVSTCCEYRHNLNVRIGGKKGRFSFVDVSGTKPCYKCLLEKQFKENQPQEDKKQNEKAPENEDDNVSIHITPRNEANYSPFEDDKLEIPVKHDDWSDKDDKEYDEFEADENEGSINKDKKSVSEFTSESKSDIDDKERKWIIDFYTTEIINGKNRDKTSGYVNVQIIGNERESQSLKFPNNFKSGKDSFDIETREIGIPANIIISTASDSSEWHLKKVELIDIKTNKKYVFPYDKILKKKRHNILSLKKEKSKISKENVKKIEENEWTVTVQTSDLKNKLMEGTDSNVYINIIGDVKESEKIWLSSSLNNKNPFEAGKSDRFKIKCEDVGKIKKLRIGHDNKGKNGGWHLAKVVLEDNKNKSYLFKCNAWLAIDEGDGEIERVLTLSTNDSTSDDESGFSHKAHIHHNEHDEVDNKLKISLVDDIKLERNRTPTRITSNKIKSPVKTRSCSSSGSATPTEKTETSITENISKEKKPPTPSSLKSNSPIEKKEKIKKNISKEFNSITSSKSNSPLDKYPEKKHEKLESPIGKRNSPTEVKVKKSPTPTNEEKKTIWIIKTYTSDLNDWNEGTDSNVYVILKGSKCNSMKQFLNLNTNENKSKIFLPGSQILFELHVEEIGDLQGLIIGHDGSGLADNWHLNKVELQNTETKDYYLFDVKRWLAMDKDDGQTKLDLNITKHEKKDKIVLTQENFIDIDIHKKEKSNLDRIRKDQTYEIISSKMDDEKLNNLEIKSEEPEDLLQSYEIEKRRDERKLVRKNSKINPQSDTSSSSSGSILSDDEDRKNVIKGKNIKNENENATVKENSQQELNRENIIRLSSLVKLAKPLNNDETKILSISETSSIKPNESLVSPHFSKSIKDSTEFKNDVKPIITRNSPIQNSVFEKNLNDDKYIIPKVNIQASSDMEENSNDNQSKETMPTYENMTASQRREERRKQQALKESSSPSDSDTTSDSDSSNSSSDSDTTSGKQKMTNKNNFNNQGDYKSITEYNNMENWYKNVVD